MPKVQARLSVKRGEDDIELTRLLLSLTTDIVKIKAKSELMTLVKERFGRIFHFSHCTICIASEDKRHYKAFLLDPASHLKGHQQYEKLISEKWPAAQEWIDEAISSGEPFICLLDKMKEEGRLPEHMCIIYEGGVREILNCGLIYENEVIGVISFLSDMADSFKPEIFPLVKAITNQISLAVINVMAREEIELKGREREALLTISDAIGRLKDRQGLLDLINTKLKQLFRFTYSVMVKLSTDGQSFTAFLLDPQSSSRSNPDYENIVSRWHPVNDGMIDRILAASIPVLIDIENEIARGSVSAYTVMQFDAGLKECVGVALRDNDQQPLGIILFYADKKGWFDSNVLHLIRAVSYHLSAAMANICYHEYIELQLKEIRRYKEKLEEEKLYLQEEISSGYTYKDIIGAGSEMQRVFHMLSQVSFAQSTVLILGETGTGKELVARAIHNASPRREKLMVKVNCAALPANLIESELFGHERGSFTGAVERRIGKFELANHGTLFLDEIGEMPLDLQVKLLRAIQEREIERVGGRTTIKTDVRIIAATNRNLQKEVAEGRFRSDLFYRLNVFPIVLPPLRDRKEDIMLLSAHFIERFAKNAGKRHVRLSSTAMKQLLAYNWPGNVRELEHVLERSVLLAEGNTIKEIHVSAQARSEHKIRVEEDFTRTLDEMEREYILGVLNKCRGKVFGPGGAAEVLGMHVSTLNHRIRKLGILKEHTYFVK